MATSALRRTACTCAQTTGRIASGTDRFGITANIDKDVTDFAHLSLTVEASLIQQDAPGAGVNGTSSPLNIIISYADSEGNDHYGLGVDNPAYLHSYVRNPGDEPIDSSSVSPVPTSQPFVANVDLMTLDPQPVHISDITIDSAGDGARQVKVTRVALTAGN